MTFLEECKEFAKPVWERYIHHQWIEALFAGTLTDEQFCFWLTQDLPYIGNNSAEVVYPKVPPHNDWIRLQREYGERSAATRVELEMLKRDDVSEFALTRWAARPQRASFINFFIRAYYEGTFGDICCSVYACYCFAETFGERYKREEPRGLPAQQKRWVEQWIDPFYSKLQAVTEQGINEYGAHATEFEKEKMRWLFLRGTNYQIGTFDVAWDCSDPWPGELVERSVLAGLPE